MANLEMNLLDIQLILTVLGELFFRSILSVTLVALLMGTLNRGTLILLPVSGLPIWLLISDYHSFAVAVSGRSVLAFYVSYLNHWFHFYFTWSVIAVSTLVILFIRRKP